MRSKTIRAQANTAAARGNFATLAMNNSDERIIALLQSVEKHFGYEPTDEQAKLFYAFARFLVSEKQRCALLVKGYAGTGKTTSISAMVKSLRALGIGTVLLAPTGRAAKVLAGYSGEPAWTIHREIYQRRNTLGGAFTFELRDNSHTGTVFFVDEASMIGGEKSSDILSEENPDLLEDLINYVFSGSRCRLVLIGDTAQLPPVGSDQSPALQLRYLRANYDLNIAELNLTEVIRQQKNSGILRNATAIRELVVEKKTVLPKLAANTPDVRLVESGLQEHIEDAFRQFGKDHTIIITRSNKRANLYNRQVRSLILGHDDEINAGDRLMVVRNNYAWLDKAGIEQAGFIANGEVLEVMRVKKFEDFGNFRFCHAAITLPDYPALDEMDVLLLCNTINADSANLGQRKMQELFETIALRHSHIGNSRMLKKAVLEDPYFNALQVKFAYAVTCHKAQGGQWPCVFIDPGFVKDEMLGVELNRWLYTAFTRAQKEIWLAGFDEKFF